MIRINVLHTGCVVRRDYGMKVKCDSYRNEGSRISLPRIHLFLPLHTIHTIYSHFTVTYLSDTLLSNILLRGIITSRETI